MANDAKLIKPIDLSPLQEAGLGKSIMKQVAEDSAELLACDPSIKKGNRDVPGEIIINDRGYCTAIQSSIYTSILSADLLEANCLFSNSEKLYLEKLYAVKNRMHPQHNTAAAFSEVFSLYLPENLSLHEYAFHSEEKCKECKHYDSCKTTYLADTEKSIKKF